MTQHQLRLGVNIDHVATIRQQRHVSYPQPEAAATLAAQHGADLITAHLREDRRHIQDNDIWQLKKLSIPLNLEMAATPDMVAFAEQVQPQYCCIVPEKRQELTTEGGLAIQQQIPSLTKVCERLADTGIQVSLFINPDEEDINAAKACSAAAVELHTGCYADATTHELQQQELNRIKNAAHHAKDLGLIVNAGHGLDYNNVQAVAAIDSIVELNIGHSIVAYAVMHGFAQAVSDMKHLMISGRQQN